MFVQTYGAALLIVLFSLVPEAYQQSPGETATGGLKDQTL
jgi:hypothetical protein